MQKPEEDPRNLGNDQEKVIDRSSSGSNNIKELIEDLKMEQRETM